MLLVEFFGSDAFLSSCAAQLAGTLFRTKRYHQQPTQPRLVYSALVGRKCGRIPRTQPAFEDTGSQGQDPQNIYSGLHRLLLCFSLHRKYSALHRLCLCTNAPRMPSLCVLRLVGRVHHVAGEFFGSDAFLSNCAAQSAGTLFRTKNTTSNPLNRDSSILLW